MRSDCIPLSYCATSFAIFVIQEQVVKAKLLQVSILVELSVI